MKSILAKDIMSSPVITLSAGDNLNTMVKLISDNNISGIPVVDDNGKLKGIVSKTDLIVYEMEKEFNHILEVDLKLIINNQDNPSGSVIETVKDANSISETKIEDIMTHYVYTAGPDSNVQSIAETMGKNQIHRMIIIENDCVIGIVTSMDLLKLISSKSFLLEK